jgi:opacity protein-like surface antigen
MRLKSHWSALFCAVVALCFVRSGMAQVAPAANQGGRPIGFGVGFSRYDLDYGPGRYMEGPVGRASVGIFHGFGIDGSARAIFMNTPPELTRMQQNTFLAGAYYETQPLIGRLRLFGRFAGGIGTIEFPSHNPLYTRDSYTVYAPSGGIEYPIVPKVFLRADYEYEFWKHYHGTNDLNPEGFTIGVTYYVQGMHARRHSAY